MTLDLDFIRSQYPVFANPETARWAMFENAGGSYVPHYKFNPAGPLHAEIAALAGIGKYIDAVDDHHFSGVEPDFHAQAARVFDLFAEHETTQANRILEALKAIPGSRIIGKDQTDTDRSLA